MTIRMPAEHGAWGILLVPLVSSALVAGGGWLAFALLLACTLGIFILRGSLDQASCAAALLDRDHLVLAAVAFAAGLALLVGFERWLLLAIALLGAALFAVHAHLLRAHQQNGAEKRSLTAELCGVLLLTLSAPAAWIAQRGSLDAQGALLWLLNVLFFLGGVIYVKYRVRGLLAHRAFRGPAERAAFAWPVLAYHLLLPLFLAALIAASSASLLVLVAFTPAILRASALLLHLGQKFPIKRLGWSEVGHALLFATLLVIALR